MKNNLISAAFVFVMCLFLLTGCDNGTKQKLTEQQQISSRFSDENQILKKRIEELEVENQKLLNTPERRLSEISSLIEKRDENGAESAISLLRNTFPQAPEVARSEKLLTSLQATLRQEREAAERKERLGFKILKEVKAFDAPGLKVSFRPPKITGRWTFDSYDDSYHYRDTTRGNRYVVARISVTAEKDVKNPNLPGFGIYEVSGKTLKLLTNMSYEFVRWDDYSSYLGNNADFRNDFAHTAKIPFSIGAEVSDEKLKEPILLIGARSNCLTRDYNRFNNPPVQYRGICRAIKQELSLDDVISENYVVIKIWNGGKL